MGTFPKFWGKSSAALNSFMVRPSLATIVFSILDSNDDSSAENEKSRLCFQVQCKQHQNTSNNHGEFATRTGDRGAVGRGLILEAPAESPIQQHLLKDVDMLRDIDEDHVWYQLRPAHMAPWIVTPRIGRVEATLKKKCNMGQPGWRPHRTGYVSNVQDALCHSGSFDWLPALRQHCQGAWCIHEQPQKTLCKWL